MKSTMVSALAAAIVFAAVTACGSRPPKPGPQPGDVTCTDGTVRMQIDCDDDLGLKEKVVDANATLGQIGLGIGAKYEERAVGQVTDSTYQLAMRLQTLCKEYNACVMSGDAYHAEAQAIRARLDSHVQLVGRLGDAPNLQAGDEVWSNAVPDLAASRLSLSYRLEASHAGGPAKVHRDGAPLQSGDQFRVVVQTNQPAYVYILLMSSQGEPSQLFPLAQMGLHNPLPADQPVAIPNDGTFDLDAHPGEESLQILASPTPLPDIESRLAQLGRGDPAAAPAARQGLLAGIGELLCDGVASTKRGVKYTKATATCEGQTRRGVTYNKSAGEPPQVATQPGDDVIVVQHRIDHR